MTVLVGITTPDGVVLASDSRTTRSDEDAHRIISDSAQKVFEIGRFGVATSGLAFVAGNTIAGLMDQFLAQLGDQDANEVDTFTDALGGFSIRGSRRGLRMRAKHGTPTSLVFR